MFKMVRVLTIRILYPYFQRAPGNTKIVRGRIARVGVWVSGATGTPPSSHPLHIRLRIPRIRPPLPRLLLHARLPHLQRRVEIVRGRA